MDSVKISMYNVFIMNERRQFIMLDDYRNDPEDYHPDDSEGNWDYDSRPDIDDYFERDGNLDNYDKDYDEWEAEQRD